LFWLGRLCHSDAMLIRTHPDNINSVGDQKMRILIVSSQYPSGEQIGGSFVHSRAKIYQKFKNEVKVFVPSDRLSGLYRFERIEVFQGSDSLGIRVLKDFDPDIIAVHMPNFHMRKVVSNLMRKRPTVLWIHGAEALVGVFHDYFAPWDVKNKVRSLLQSPLRLIVIRRLIKEAKAVVYNSRWMKDTAERYTQMKHPLSFIIPNPVDTEFILGRKEVKTQQTLNKGISIRRLDWKYGLDIAIRAYSNLTDTSLTIRGKGSLFKYLHLLASKCNSNVHFKTKIIKRNMMPQMYEKFGYFVAPSRTETQGVAMCEAMACGLPVIAARVGGIPEFVKNGFNGLLVPPDNPSALRRAVRNLLSHHTLYKTLSNNSQRFVEENLSPKKVYELDYVAFRNVVSSH
jgi:glycosyltransferase involved in cell wall biosynthesis